MFHNAQRTAVFTTGLQAAANVATLVAACLLSVVLVKSYLLPKPTVPSAPKTVAIGASLQSQLPGVDWRGNGRTVVLALSTGCHFCTESAPFFQRLSKEAGKKFRVVAVLPEPLATAQDYLKRENVHVDGVRQISLGQLGVDGTPTMLLLDNHGTVLETWVGKLTAEGQDRAIKVITATL